MNRASWMLFALLVGCGSPDPPPPPPMPTPEEIETRERELDAILVGVRNLRILPGPDSADVAYAEELAAHLAEQGLGEALSSHTEPPDLEPPAVTVGPGGEAADAVLRVTCHSLELSPVRPGDFSYEYDVGLELEVGEVRLAWRRDVTGSTTGGWVMPDDPDEARLAFARRLASGTFAGVPWASARGPYVLR